MITFEVMKYIFFLCLAVMTHLAMAQTPNEGLPPELRVVDGITYDVQNSTNWGRFSDMVQSVFNTLDGANVLPGPWARPVVLDYRVFTNYTLVKIESEHAKYDAYAAEYSMQHSTRWVVVLNGGVNSFL